MFLLSSSGGGESVNKSSRLRGEKTPSVGDRVIFPRGVIEGELCLSKLNFQIEDLNVWQYRRAGTKRQTYYGTAEKGGELALHPPPPLLASLREARSYSDGFILSPLPPTHNVCGGGLRGDIRGV